MATPPISRTDAQKFYDALHQSLKEGHYPPNHPQINGRDRRSAVGVAGEKCGVRSGSINNRLEAAIRVLGKEPDWTLFREKPKDFEVEELPDELPPIADLLAERRKKFARKDRAEAAKHLINVDIRIDGPFAVAHFGDPHVDDDGTDIGQLERDVEIVRKTEGMFGANVGDLQNNWVGRLSHLWGQQSTSAREAWALTEWLVKSIDWLYLVGGNHDCWSGEGDPLKWMMDSQAGVFEAWGARLNLRAPNGKCVRINARHDFAGHSMWNQVHGPAKAIQMGWRDHILTCGHKHTSGYNVLKDPSSGLISHAIRAAGYKKRDRYASEKGLPNQNIFPTAVTIIDPRYADDDPKLITTMFDVERGADFLKYLRRRK
jgi:hypothetical protein